MVVSTGDSTRSSSGSGPNANSSPEAKPFHVAVLSALVFDGASITHLLGEFHLQGFAPLRKEDVGVHSTAGSVFDPLPLTVVTEERFYSK